MTIYNINLGIGWASSGVEYAQAYRAGVLRELGIPAKFIFTDFFQTENLQHFTSNIGFEDQEVIWLYTAFTDQKMTESTFSLTELEETFSAEIASKVAQGDLVRYQFEASDLQVTAFMHDTEKGYLQRVEYLSQGTLFRKDYYSDCKVFSEFYAKDGDKLRLYKRSFFNRDGRIAYEELLNTDNTSLFRFPEKICYSKDELVAYFLEKLALTSQDIILLDRATGIGQSVFQHKGAAKLAVVIHAEHFNEKASNKQNVLWNNYYEYQFTNADKVDAFIASTEKQKEVLVQQFKTYTDFEPKIYSIPVGSLDKLRRPMANRKPFSMITGSRLAAEKHIDWLVQAVINAHQQLPQLTFDIYGEGGQRQLLVKMIEENAAQDYIHLKGHQDLTEIYQDYEVYLTASTSEGFGLTLMEAVGSGLPLIGLDVPYGNQTFVDNGKNGYLIPRQEPDDAAQMAEAFADRIVAFYKDLYRESTYEYSYQKASAFLNKELEAEWTRFVKELADD
ncbi:accessory Sec system glycosyltransferase GtfA [Streptococcus loxodontisalivarius]|uniref:UDP-N-acetylglucosamine--peptide N-acetylglucosaminyltransferase GtfA subunit n=1 Tax=Streptococcus loxodontisalivarius TaxID=1349415 RepID=A0ABS2PUD6_9STRE|nr:accessory Sec system glycosyltransferase GtfA [Streptococcus loxodontisalivarius]MBM7643491.1 accessory Sec system glycosylation protein GtfA [Streptococcus loxodontisalivarius]